jgi:alkanesulfonate monooxygenase SsuD/methylene tetrahydromethanopterin reductase-like flavin-dependent oxidoreductase (luciferase family)
VEESRARYRETLDIFFAACGTSVLEYEGRYHSYKGLELQLKPLQQPYPPLWFPSSDPSSIEFTARQRRAGHQASARAIFWAARVAIAMIVTCGLTPIAVGTAEPSTT